MLHSTAGVYAQTNHANAKTMGLAALVKREEIGIDKPGHVSKLGLARTTLAKLSVGPVESTNVPISVFETPVPDMNGMLGIKWIDDKQAIVDFDDQKLYFPQTDAQANQFDNNLVNNGFVEHKIYKVPGDAFYRVSGAVNGKVADFTVSTVGDTVLDTNYAGTAKIDLGPSVDHFYGPTGRVGDVYIAKRPLTLSIGEQTTPTIQPLIYDTNAYSGAQPSKVGVPPSSGLLGAAFMLANSAVIDFRTHVLLLKRSE